MSPLLAAMVLASAVQPVEKIILLRSPGEPSLSVRHVPGRGKTILYVHGSTFPAALSMNYRIEGKSWADDLHARGFDVWSFDFAGYGNSDRQNSMVHPEASVIPGRAVDAARQIERVTQFIREQTGHERVSIIAHSWGTIPAGLFTGRHPSRVDRLVLFGPVAERKGKEDGPRSAVRLVSAEDQWASFQSGLPKRHGSLISQSRFQSWARSYLATDKAASTRDPPSVAVPSGPDADFADAWSGHLPYNPSLIRSRTLIVRGEWDPITRDADAAWLVRALDHVPGGARDLKLPHGAHRMHLERNREALFRATGDFLAGDSE